MPQAWLLKGMILMDKPILSPEFTLEDIRKLRNYNSYRHASMTLEELREDMRPAVEEFNRLMADYKNKNKPWQFN